MNHFVSEAEIIELEVFKEQLKSEIEDEVIINRFVDRLRMDNKSTYRIYVEVLDRSIISNLGRTINQLFLKIIRLFLKDLKLQRQT